MIKRRSIFTAAAATVAGSTLGGRHAAGASAGELFDIEPRGSDGRMERLPSLGLESVQGYTAGFREWHSREVNRVAIARTLQIFEENGIDPDADLSVEEVLDLIGTDPVIAMSGRLWLSNQQVTWKALQDRFHAQADMYLAEMESFDRRGPGTLELAPTMNIPDYVKHEIHIQPGGYVGDPFAGHLYHYGTSSFYHGIYGSGNVQDEVHAGSAQKLPLPADGKVRRILDLGCGIGQLTIALKERFPEAEVWGLDIGAPMIRYGHMRAVELGVDVNFIQRLAEDTGFPDDYFDIVTSYLVHHEMPGEVSKAVFREAYRVARPGGYYYPIDFRSGRQARRRSAYGQFRRWWDHRWNNERWSFEFGALAFEEEMESAGLKLNPDAPEALRGFGVRQGIKLA